eukprot:1161105-Pelagomonas_calceolata.AAC.4
MPALVILGMLVRSIPGMTCAIMLALVLPGPLTVRDASPCYTWHAREVNSRNDLCNYTGLGRTCPSRCQRMPALCCTLGAA